MEARRTVNPNGTYCYTLDGKVVRKASKREFNFMLVSAHEDGTARFIGLGNNATTLMSSWKHLYEGCDLKVITVLS